MLIPNSTQIPVGYIYLIKSNGCYKIGRSKNATARLRTYRTENPFGIEVVLCEPVDDPIIVERFLLERITEKQEPAYGKEWFNLSESLVENIKGFLKLMSLDYGALTNG